MDARALGLLEQALTLPAEQREAQLRALAGDDPALLADALALLQAHQQSEGLLEASPVPEYLGRWRLLQRIGAGGMGEVFRVEREDAGYRQQAALKLTAMGWAGAEARARFHAERQFMARLEHPNIARIIDGGSAPDGRPWVVMEYVDGVPIDDWCAAQRSSIRGRVSLFLQVLAAVDAAHRALILHRDLKPSNILVTADGQAKLLDFGIAKSLADDAHLTLTGPGPLTPQYASPEQLAGQPLTTASDVYSAGLVLHRLLTGALPADQGRGTNSTRRSGAGWTRPSALLDGQALALSTDEQRAWQRQLAGDLDRVLLKALARDVSRRYPSASALAEDLQRWLDWRPVAARQGDRGYRLRLFLRRNRLAVTAAAAAIVSLSLGLALAAQQAALARQQAARAESAREFLLQLISEADPVASGREPSLKDAIDQAQARLSEVFAGQPEAEADLRIGIGRAYTNLMQLEAAEQQFQRALSLLQPEETGYAAALQAQALLDWTLGRTDRAEQGYRQALTLTAADPAQRLAAGAVRNDLAALYNDLGRHEEAIELATASVEDARQLELEPGALGARLENLGSALQGAGRLEEAEAVYGQAIAALEQALPARTIALAVALNNYGLVQRDRGDPAAALTQFERAIALRRAAFGDDHAELAGPLTNAARMRLQLGDLVGAKRDIELALQLAERAYAPDYLARGHVALAAAEIALAAGDGTLARQRATAALAVFERADAADPRWLARARALAESPLP